MTYYIKYGNRLYLADLLKLGPVWTTYLFEAKRYGDINQAQKTLDYVAVGQGLYEARIVEESDIDLTVESVP